MKTRMKMLAAALTMADASGASAADTSAADTPPPLQVPAKTLQVPTADISPGMQKFIAAPLNPDWNFHPKTGENGAPRPTRSPKASCPGCRRCASACTSRSRPRPLMVLRSTS